MEAVPGYPNLHRRNETYYLYKRVPKGLLEAYNGKPFIRRSLKTKDLKEAKVLLHKALVELDKEFAKVEAGLKETVTPQEAQEIANGRLTDLLIEDMEQRQDGDPEGAEVFDAVRQQLQSIGGVTFTTKKEASAEFGMSDRDYRQQQQTIDQMKPHYRAANARQNLGAVADDVEFVCEEHHLRLQKGSDGWRCLAREMLNMWVKYFDIVEKRQNGEPVAFDLTPPPYSSQDAQGWTRVAPSVASKSSLSLRELVDRYVSDPSRNASQRTNDSYEVIFRTMRDVIGAEKDLNAITRDDCRNVMNALIKTPVNAAQRFPHLDTFAVIKKAEGRDMKMLSPSTINNRLINMSALFRWAVKEEYMLRNPAEGLSVNDPVKKKNKRRSFPIEDLQTIFSAPLYTGCKSELKYHERGNVIVKKGHYWVPLIALWTGMRLGECCQLHCDDIRQIEGVWCIIIQETEDGEDWDEADRKRIKTDAGERFVPIHNELEKLGLIEYAKEQKKTGSVRLFPELKPSKNGYLSNNFSKWFNDKRRFLGKLGLAGKGPTFHSLRHNYRDAMREACLSRDVVLALGGWSSGRTDDQYGGSISAKFLKEQIDKVEYKGLKMPAG